MSRKQTGTTIMSRWRAAIRFSNCPPHAIQLPGGSFTCSRDLGLRLGDERADVAAAHVAGDGDAALAVLAGDFVEPFDHLHPGDGREGNEPERRLPPATADGGAFDADAIASPPSAGRRGSQRDRQILQGVQILAHRDRESERPARTGGPLPESRRPPARRWRWRPRPARPSRPGRSGSGRPLSGVTVISGNPSV